MVPFNVKSTVEKKFSRIMGNVNLRKILVICNLPWLRSFDCNLKIDIDPKRYKSLLK